MRAITQQVDTHMTKVEARMEETTKEINMLRANLDENSSRIKELEEEIKATKLKDAKISSDVGAYNCMKSCLEMIEEFLQGKHES